MNKKPTTRGSKELYLKTYDKKNFFFTYVFLNKILNKMVKKNSKTKLLKKMMTLSINLKKKTGNSLPTILKDKLIPNRLPIKFISKYTGKTKSLIPVFSSEKVELKNVINWFFESLKSKKEKKFDDYLLREFLDLNENKSNITNIRNCYLKKVFLNKNNLRFLKNKKK